MPKPKRYQPKHGPATWRVRLRRSDGTETSETFTTRDEAEAFCIDVRDVGADEAIRLRTERNEAAGHLTLDELAEDFFEWKSKRVRSDRTVADYRRDYGNWIKPRFGARRATSLSETEVQRWVDAMRDGMDKRRPASPKSIADRHALLHGILERGVRIKAVTANPCVGTDLPKKQRGLPKGLRPNEWAALHAALVTIDQDAADVAEGLLATGWRWSEVTAMAVGQVEDTVGAGVYVSMDRVVRRNAAGEFVIVHEGKGQASVRRVKIDEGAAAMFRRRVVGKSLGDLVFTTASGEQLHYSNFRRDAWDPAVKAANLSRRPTPHWLRHTHVVWMALTGASLPELQSRIGHASITTTINVYGRMLNDVSDRALDGFAAMRDAPLDAQIEG